MLDRGRVRARYYICAVEGCPARKNVKFDLTGKIIDVKCKEKHNHPPPPRPTRVAVPVPAGSTPLFMDTSEMGDPVVETVESE